MSREAREQLVDRFAAANLPVDRFIQCLEGEKGTHDHEQKPPSDVDGNYGIYANGDDALCILDVDDYGDLDDKSGISALRNLPPTLEQGSPHGGTHKFYRVEPTEDGRLVAAALADAFESEKGNLKPSWGEVRVNNQYVVGAGSILDGCDKDWCDECATDDGGQYVIQSDTDIATVSCEELIDVLSDDPSLDTSDSDDGVVESAPGLAEDADLSDRLEFAREHDDLLDDLLRGDYSDYYDSDAKNGVDRSRAEYALAAKLAYWLEGDTSAVERVFDRELPRRIKKGVSSKWHERDDESYRSSIRKRVRKQTEFFDPASGRSPEPPDPSEIDWGQVERGEALLEAETTPTEPAGELVEENGCYGIEWVYTDDEGNIQDSGVDTVCNFTLETLSFLNTEEGTQIVLRVNPDSPSEDSYDVRVEPSVFNSSETFRKEIVIGLTTWFDPTTRQDVTTISILRYLRETVGEQRAPHREGTPHIGLSEDRSEFVTPNGSLTADGWHEDPQYHFYTKKGDDGDETGALPQKWALDPDDEVEVSELDVAKICELLPNIRNLERGLPILGWFYAAPLKPYIHQWEDEFPLLGPKGDTGTGKTSAIRQYQKAMGGDGEPFSASDTSFTIEKHLAESRGFPVWFDEYKPTEMRPDRLKRLHRRLKEVTKERTLAKGTPGLGEVTLHLRAPVVLSGEQKLSDAAVRRRAIITDLSHEATQDGTLTKEAFGELTGTAYEDSEGGQNYPDGYDLSQHARAYYEWLMGLSETELKERWQTARERVKEIQKSLGVTLEESEQRGLQTVVFGTRLHRSFAESVGAEKERLPTEADELRACEHVVENIGKGGQRREHADEFLALLSSAATEDYLEEGVHHRLVESQSFECEALAVHMPSAFAAVKKFVRDWNLEDDRTVLQKEDYLDSFRNKAEVGGSYVLDVNRRVKNLENGSKAVFFDPGTVSDKLGGDFNLDSFVAAENDIELDDDLEAVTTPVTALTGTGHPFADITVHVPDHRSPDDGPAFSGTFTDATGTIEYVDWEGCEVSEQLEEGGTYLLQDIKVGFDKNGAIRLEPARQTTEATEIQRGAGHTGDSDVAEGQSQLEDAAADGGAIDRDAGEPSRLAQKQLVQKIQQWTTAKRSGSRGAPRDDVVAALVEDEGQDRHRVEHQIDQLLQQSNAGLYEPTEDHLDVV